MKLQEMKYSVQNLLNRKLRSFLTILSILIGITAVFALISFGLGIQNYVNTLADEAGADKLYVQPRGASAPGLDDSFALSKEDLDFIKKVNGVKEAIGIYMKVGRISSDDQEEYAFIMGYDPDNADFLFEGFTAEILEGRELKEGEIRKVSLGYNYQVADKIFEKPLAVGDKVLVNDERFEVVGFYSEIGNPGDDANIYLTEEALEMLYPASEGRYGMAMVQAQPGEEVDELADEIEKKLRRYKGEEEGKESFFVQTFDDVLETFGTVISIINNVLLLISLVSVVVASVNIMNTMYTSVLERTKEIGIMKAIGARNSDIRFIFIFESALLGFIGGVLGIILGYAISSLGGAIAAAFGFSALKPIFPVTLIAACLLFATAIGAVSGIFPAIQASNLSPVDALRYE